MGVSGGRAVEELGSTGAQKKGEVARGSVGLRDKPFLRKVLNLGCSTVKVHTYPLGSLFKFQIPRRHP